MIFYGNCADSAIYLQSDHQYTDCRNGGNDMKCPFCGYEDTKVTDSRSIGGKTRRRRECSSCGKRFTTYETVETPVILVNKKDNTFEPFDRAKLIQSMSIAVKKRPVSVNDINGIVEEIENTCASNSLSQISTIQIGNIVLDSLKRLDHVAYIRFASVYKDFSDTASFLELISEIENDG